MNHQRMRRRVKIAQVLLVLIVIAGTVYVADTVVGGSLFHDPYTVTVDLRNAAGLHDSSTVNYRGQRIGKVTDVQLDETGVVAELAIDEGVKVPRDSEFLVRNLSAVGEQYVDIRPRTDSGPWLADGTVIAADETRTPLPVHRVVADTQHLLRRIDLRDLRTITRESDAAFGDGAADLRGTSVELERSVRLLRQLEPDLATLVERGQVPLRTGVERAGQLRRFSRNLALIAHELRGADPTIRRLVDDGATVLPLLQRFWDATSPTLVSLVAVAAPLMRMSETHLPGLHVWLDWVPRQVAAMAGSTRDGTGWVSLVPKSLKNCVYTHDQRDPSQLRRRPLQLDNRCHTHEHGVQARGSQNVPRP